MAGVCKRKSDKARGKAGKWTAWWVDESGKQRTKVAFVDKAKSLEFAQARETEAKRVREGLVDPAERSRREAGFKAVADHVADYALDLHAKGDTPKHYKNVRSTLGRLFEDASVVSLGDIDQARVQQALGRLRVRRSARTCNKALGYVKAFTIWLADNNRIKEVPRGLSRIELSNEAADRKYRRRALTADELVRLLAAAEAGPPVVGARGKLRGPRPVTPITGPERAAVYRLAMGTGFRAREIRTLTPERFALDGPSPTVTVLAGYAKNGKEAVQPITPELAEALRPFVAGKPRGVRVFALPERPAPVLAADLVAAGVSPVDADGGVVDFHSLRHSFITNLVMSGTNPKVAQILARHSTIALTLDRYTHVGHDDLRTALSRAAQG